MRRRPPPLLWLGAWGNPRPWCRASGLPYVSTLMNPDWLPAAEWDLLAGYLRAGVSYAAHGGMEPCIVCEQGLDTSVRTDGVWGWPDTLAHYVEQHRVALPEAFLEYARLGGWRVPEVERGSFEPFPPDTAFWQAWASRYIEERFSRARR